MIILQLVEDELKSPKRRLSKKIKEPVLKYSRFGIVVNNKPHFIISVTKDTLEQDEFQQLLNKYKGLVVAPVELEKCDLVNSVLFDVNPYLKKAIFENLRLNLMNEKLQNSALLIRDINFTLKDEIPALLPYIKNIVVSTSDDSKSKYWIENCFLEYGVRPSVVVDENIDFLNFDIVADFEKLRDNTLEVKIFDEVRTIYPNVRFSRVPDELKVLENFNINNFVICSAFS